jgi:hypothetical protein
LRFEIMALESVRPQEPAAPIAAQREVPFQVGPAAVTPEPIMVAPEPEPLPAPPASYAALVPDLDDRVDAILTRQDAPAKRRKRAPIPAPLFEPLRREPWEDRLDIALAGRG